MFMSIWLGFSYLYFPIFLKHCFYCWRLTKAALIQRGKGKPKDNVRYSLKGLTLMRELAWQWVLVTGQVVLSFRRPMMCLCSTCGLS